VESSLDDVPERRSWRSRRRRSPSPSRSPPTSLGCWSRRAAAT